MQPTDPKQLYDIAIDPRKLHDIGRDALNRRQHIFPFLTAVAGQVVNCQFFEWLSVLTDGGINPLNNTAGGSDLFIQFSQGENILINSEIRNIPIHNRESFTLYNRISTTQVASEGLETGYNNLILMLSKVPFNEAVKKENPHFCIQEIVPALTTRELWLGVNKSNVNYQLMIPYIPIGYRTLRLGVVMWNGTPANLTVAEYIFPKCWGQVPAWNDFFVVQVNYTNNASVGQCNNIEICSSRFKVSYTNNHATNDMNVQMIGMFVDKSDNGI